MDFEEFKQCFKHLEEFNEEADFQNGLIYKLCGGMLEHGYMLMDAYIELLSKNVGDENEWINYYIFECEFGKKPMEVTVDKKKIKLDSLEKLWKIIKNEK